MLPQMAEQALPVRLKPGLLSYCPTMDLIALATEDEQVQVFRLNGQSVFTVPKQDENAAVAALCWKPNGRALIVAFGDGAISLVSTWTGKVIKHIQPPPDTETSICSLGWGINFTDPVMAKSLLESPKLQPGAGIAALKSLQRGGLLEEALARGLHALDIQVPLDLPGELRNIDLESSLPKLSILPASGSSDDVFSTRTSIDTIFHTANKDSNDLADVILVNFDDGSVNLNIYDFFELGRFSSLARHGAGHVVRHCSHPYSSTHGLLVQQKLSGSLSFFPLDFKLIPDTGPYLSLLASKSGQIQNIVRYMKATVSQICSEFKTSQELPHRFMRNAEEDLQEKEKDTFVNAMYHFAATGDCSQTLREWLTEQIGDRGHKRWEKAAMSGYEGVSKYTAQNLLPALDRFMMLVCRLRGFSRFFESSESLGLSTSDLNLILDTASCIRLVGDSVLETASEELSGFVAFSSWTKLEMEVQNTEPTSASVDDFPAKYAEIDYTKLFDYVQGGMEKSKLVDLCSDEEPSKPTVSDLLVQKYPIYEEFKKAMEETSAKRPRPSLRAILARLEKHCQATFSGIATALQRKTRLGSGIPIHKDNVGVFDLIMLDCEREKDGVACCGVVAISLPATSSIGLKWIDLNVTNGMSSTDSVYTAQVKLPSDRIIRDARFVDEKTLVVVTSSSGRGHPWIAYLPYRQQADEANGLQYTRLTDARADGEWGPVLDLSDEERAEAYIAHVFDDSPPWIPVQVEVNGRKGRRALCVVASDRLRYRVFDLDNALDSEQQVEDEDEMELEES